MPFSHFSSKKYARHQEIIGCLKPKTGKAEYHSLSRAKNKIRQRMQSIGADDGLRKK